MRKALLAAFPALTIFMLWVWATLNSELFPDPVAIHWGITGEPDGFASLQSHLLLINLSLGLVAAIWAAIVYLKPIPKTLRNLFLVITGYLFVFMFALMFGTLWIQLGQPDATSASLGISWFAWMAPILLLVPMFLTMPSIDVSHAVRVLYFGLPLLTIEFSDIAQVGASTAKARDFGGLGIRFSRKTTAFLPSAGPVVELTLVGGERILIRSKHPDEIVGEIERKRTNS